MAAAEGRRDGDRGRVVVFGSPLPALDRPFVELHDTRQLILNSVYWLTGREGLAAGVGREVGTDRIPMDSAFLSALYMTRLVILTFFGAPKDLDVIKRTKEASPLITAPLVLLTLLTLFVGWFALDQVGDAFGFPGGINNYIYFPEPEVFSFNAGLAAATGVLSLLGILTAWWFWWGGHVRRATVGDRPVGAAIGRDGGLVRPPHRERHGRQRAGGHGQVHGLLDQIPCHRAASGLRAADDRWHRGGGSARILAADLTGDSSRIAEAMRGERRGTQALCSGNSS